MSVSSATYQRRANPFSTSRDLSLAVMHRLNFTEQIVGTYPERAAASLVIADFLHNLGPTGAGLFTQEQIDQALLDLPLPRTGCLEYAGFRYYMKDNLLITPEGYVTSLYRTSKDTGQIDLMVALMKRGIESGGDPTRNLLTFHEEQCILGWRGLAYKDVRESLRAREYDLRKRIRDTRLSGHNNPARFKHLNMVPGIGLSLI